jgi:hypothetical protein
MTQWTEETVIQTLQSGEKIRWLPKRIIYNEVRGGNYRLLYVGKRMTTETESYDIGGILTELRKRGVVKRVFTQGIIEYILTGKL